MRCVQHVREEGLMHGHAIIEETQAHRKQANEDLKNIVRAMKQAGKRRSAPPWSVPMELWLMMMAPDYRSVRGAPTEGVGYVRDAK